jgi:hypothetical protein
VGVSRRIGSDRERRRLRDIVSRARPKDLGFIIRTAGEGTREADIEADVAYLAAVWEEIRSAQTGARAPATLYELSLPLRAIRDFANGRTRRIVVDDRGIHEKMQRFLDRFVADPKPRLDLYQGTEPLFDREGLESRIDENLGKKVWLKSGGYLIVDQSEALTAIDVNTGRYVGKRDLEETVLKTNLEAVQEVVHQLRFRNLGGLIIIDLIDMESAENRDKVYRALQEALRGDKARTNILKISELGLVEMTRKRTRENLVQLLCEPCSFCEGRGYVLSADRWPISCCARSGMTCRAWRPSDRGVGEHASAEMPQGPAPRARRASSSPREIEVRAAVGSSPGAARGGGADRVRGASKAWLESREERSPPDARRARRGAARRPRRRPERRGEAVVEVGPEPEALPGRVRAAAVTGAGGAVADEDELILHGSTSEDRDVRGDPPVAKHPRRAG